MDTGLRRSHHRPILPGFAQFVGRRRASRMPMVFAGMITSTNSSQGMPFFTSTWTVDRCRGIRILAGNPWLASSESCASPACAARSYQ